MRRASGNHDAKLLDHHFLHLCQQRESLSRHPVPGNISSAGVHERELRQNHLTGVATPLHFALVAVGRTVERHHQRVGSQLCSERPEHRFTAQVAFAFPSQEFVRGEPCHHPNRATWDSDAKRGTVLVVHLCEVLQRVHPQSESIAKQGQARNERRQAVSGSCRKARGGRGHSRVPSIGMARSSRWASTPDTVGGFGHVSPTQAPASHRCRNICGKDSALIPTHLPYLEPSVRELSGGRVHAAVVAPHHGVDQHQPPDPSDHLRRHIG